MSYVPFRASRKILSDNETKFNNKLFEEVTEKLGIGRKVYSPAYRPQANGRIKGFHKYLNRVHWEAHMQTSRVG